MLPEQSKARASLEGYLIHKETSLLSGLEQRMPLGRALRGGKWGAFAEKLADLQHPLGHHWVDRFLERHPSIKWKTLRI